MTIKPVPFSDNKRMSLKVERVVLVKVELPPVVPVFEDTHVTVVRSRGSLVW